MGDKKDSGEIEAIAAIGYLAVARKDVDVQSSYNAHAR